MTGLFADRLIPVGYFQESPRHASYTAHTRRIYGTSQEDLPVTIANRREGTEGIISGFPVYAGETVFPPLGSG